MATEVHQFSATIPADTPFDTPVTIALEQANYEIESIDIQVPPGPSGLVGFYLALADTQWIPFEAGEFIVWDDHIASYATENQIVNGGWNLVGYNGGAFDHTITITFHTNPIGSADAPAPYVPFTGPTVVIQTSPLTDDETVSV